MPKNISSISRLSALSAAILSAFSLTACGGSSSGSLADIDTVVVIYAENRSFDNLYGLYPGANGIANALSDPASYTQLDRDGSVLPTLPPVWNASAAQAPAWSFVASLPNKPFQINATQPGGAPGQDPTVTSPDLVHRFYNNQMQINGGKNNMYAAWSDAGGLSMGYYDGSSMAHVEDRAAIHAGRQLLPGRVRRLVPEPLLAGVRVHAGLEQPARGPHFECRCSGRHAHPRRRARPPAR